MKFKNILVPTDFSARANAALAVAADIAAQSGASITLMHTIEVAEAQRPEYERALDTFGEHDGETSESDVPHVIAAMQYTKRNMREVREKYPKITFTERVYFDRVHRQIHSMIDDEGFDLIVMGSNGSSGLDEVFIGSNTQKVIRNAKVPVLVVKDDKADFNFRNIVFASDFTTHGGKGVSMFPVFKELYGSSIHLLNIITPSTFEATPTTKKRMQEFAKTANLEDYTVSVFNYYTEEEGILTFAEENEADMILLATHGRKGFSRFMMGSIAENVANHSKIPVLVYRQD